MAGESTAHDDDNDDVEEEVVAAYTFDDATMQRRRRPALSETKLIGSWPRDRHNHTRTHTHTNTIDGHTITYVGGVWLVSMIVSPSWGVSSRAHTLGGGEDTEKTRTQTREREARWSKSQQGREEIDANKQDTQLNQQIDDSTTTEVITHTDHETMCVL